MKHNGQQRERDKGVRGGDNGDKEMHERIDTPNFFLHTHTCMKYHFISLEVFSSM